MGRTVYLPGTRGAALAAAHPDLDGRCWAIARGDLVTHVAWSGPCDHALFALPMGQSLLGEELDEEPPGLRWEPLPVSIHPRRLAA